MDHQDLIQSCQRFLQLWHDNKPQGYGSNKRMVERRDFICLDHDNGPDSWSGVFMVRKADWQVFGIKAYGRVNLKRPHGNILDIITKLALANVDNQELTDFRMFA
jgi:hypothetical protein